MTLFRFNASGCVFFYLTNLIVSLAAAVLVYNLSTTFSPAQSGATFLQVSLVWWEDLAFVLPLLVVPRQWLLFVLPILFYRFSIGHSYKPTAAMWATGLYIPLAAAFAYRYGIITIMVAHVFHDVVCVSAIKILNHFIQQGK